ncbi:MAG TPA: hypothetical protein VLK84_13270 [Longimicrobium sp.]|nr:hypothetical protein [Longimicrobium sp.]
MSGSILGRTAFSAAVALVIGFGAREAFATPAAAQAGLYCRDDAHCQAICEAMHPGYDAIAWCSPSHTCGC